MINRIHKILTENKPAAISIVLLGVVANLYTFWPRKEVEPMVDTTAPISNSIITSGQSGGLNTVIVNEVATYEWDNRNSWKPNYHNGAYGEGNYRTDLVFKASGKIYPEYVCPQVKFYSKNPIKAIDLKLSGASTALTSADGKSTCFRAERSKENIVFELVTQGIPTKIEARLINRD